MCTAFGLEMATSIPVVNMSEFAQRISVGVSSVHRVCQDSSYITRSGMRLIDKERLVPEVDQLARAH